MSRTTPSTDIIARVNEAARLVAPGFAAERVIARSTKTHLVRGTLAGRAVVAKLLSNRQPHWRYYLAREIGIYQHFARHPPPVAVPGFVGADAQATLLLLEVVEGRSPARGRLASARVTVSVMERLVDAVLALDGWASAPQGIVSEAERAWASRMQDDRGPRARPLPDPRDTAGWLRRATERWVERQIVTREDAERAGEQLGAPLSLGFAHGDLLLRNVVLSEAEAGAPLLLDWEFAGTFPFGWDLGLLWVGLGAGPVRTALEARLSTLSAQRARQSWLGAFCAAARELEVRLFSLRQPRTHPLARRLDDDLTRAARHL